MRNIIYVVTLFLLVACANKQAMNPSTLFNPNETKKKIIKKNWYIKNYIETGYAKKEDIGKDMRNLSRDDLVSFQMGDLVTISDYAYYDEDEMVKIQSENKTAWLSLKSLCNGFAVIAKSDAIVYQFPLRTSDLSYSLLVGTVGYVYREESNFLNCDFRIFIEKDEQRIYVGNKWVDKKDVVTEIEAAKQAYIYFLAENSAKRGLFDDAHAYFSKAQSMGNEYPFLSVYANAIYELIKKNEVFEDKEE